MSLSTRARKNFVLWWLYLENCFGYSIVNVKYKIFISGIYSHPENVRNTRIIDTALIGIKKDYNNQRVTQKYTFT